MKLKVFRLVNSCGHFLRGCFLIPFIVNLQRFYEHGGELQDAHDAPLRPSMDIFAVG